MVWNCLAQYLHGFFSYPNKVFWDQCLLFYFWDAFHTYLVWKNGWGMKLIGLHLHNSLVPFGYEKNPIFAKKKFHTLGYENIGCFFLMRRRALRRALQVPERSLDEWTWTDYYRNPCICNRWPFSSARGSGARDVLHHLSLWLLAFFKFFLAPP